MVSVSMKAVAYASTKTAAPMAASCAALPYLCVACSTRRSTTLESAW